MTAACMILHPFQAPEARHRCSNRPPHQSLKPRRGDILRRDAAPAGLNHQYASRSTTMPRLRRSNPPSAPHPGAPAPPSRLTGALKRTVGNPCRRLRNPFPTVRRRCRHRRNASGRSGRPCRNLRNTSRRSGTSAGIAGTPSGRSICPCRELRNASGPSAHGAGPSELASSSLSMSHL